MKNKTEFCFVILNYNTYDYTCECIDSIKEHCNKDLMKILIVDNLSPDKSGEKLLKTYKNDKNIKVLLNVTNAGFAAGNNFGIKFALKNYNPKFIIVNNSDTKILSNNFFENIYKAYEKYHFAILGPKIIIKDNKVQYIPYKLPTIKETKKTILRYFVYYFINLINLPQLEKIIFKPHYPIEKTDKNTNKIYEDMILHGAFFIFSQKYLEHYEGIPTTTKYYREEEFLYLNCLKKNLKTLYYPKIEIYHDEGGSVKRSYKDLRKQNLFRFKRHIEANKILYKHLKENSTEVKK